MLIIYATVFLVFLALVGGMIYVHMAKPENQVPKDEASRQRLQQVRAELIIKKEKLDNEREIATINAQLAKIDRNLAKY